MQATQRCGSCDGHVGLDATSIRRSGSARVNKSIERRRVNKIVREITRERERERERASGERECEGEKTAE